MNLTKRALLQTSLAVAAGAGLGHRLIMAHPDARGGKFDEAEVVEVVFLEPRGDRAEMLELSEEALDQISVAVEP